MVVQDPMLLTLSSSAKNEFEFRNSLHDFPSAHRTAINTSSSDHHHYHPNFAVSKQTATALGAGAASLSSSYSPSLEERRDHRGSSSVSDFLSIALAEAPNRTMTTPHRGLPPPGQLTLPDPGRPSHPPVPPPAPPQQQYGSSNLAGLPAPPSNWGGSDEMRNWLAAKTEEDKRRAEEEKRRAEEERSKQEELRLERRKVEQSMLMESIRSGVPPYLIPFFFLGLGGGLSPEWIQQYLGQVAPLQPQGPPMAPGGPGSSPEAQRAGIPVPFPGAVHPPQPQTVPHTPVTGPGQPYSFPGAPRPGEPSASSRSGYPAPPLLPRLATGEAQTPQVHSAGPIGPTQPQESSPLHFHHWQPPTSAAAGASSVKEQGPATPSAEYASSPKKRKAAGTHQPAPPPSRSFEPSASNSSGSSNRRGGHSRHRSDVSSMRATVPDSSSAPRTPLERQQTPTLQQQQQQQQQWHHHHAPPPSTAGPPPPLPPPPPPPQSRSSYGEQTPTPILQQPLTDGTPFSSRQSSQLQLSTSGTHSTPATSDDRAGTNEDVEMGER